MNSNAFGIGRAAYLGCLVAFFVTGIMIGLSHPSGRYWESPPKAFLMLASFPLLIAATALRLINIGRSGWLATLLFAPFLR